VSGGKVSVETYVGVADTYNRYVQSLDAGDMATVEDCFTEDAALVIRGRPEIRGIDALRGFWAARPADRPPVKHVVGGIWVRADRGDGADITAALLLVDLSHGRIVGAGNSDDVLRRGDDGRWRFVGKNVRLDYHGDASEGAPRQG
jgi:ketosteroid isomerase-like protein